MSFYSLTYCIHDICTAYGYSSSKTEMVVNPQVSVIQPLHNTHRSCLDRYTGNFESYIAQRDNIYIHVYIYVLQRPICIRYLSVFRCDISAVLLVFDIKLYSYVISMPCGLYLISTLI